MVAFAVGYLAVCAAVYFGQEQLLFHPRAIAADEHIDWGEERWITTPAGDSLHTVWASGGAETVVLYFHGNVGDVNRGMYQVRSLLAAPDMDVVIVDYRSFGKTPGPLLNDDQLLADMQSVYDAVAETYGEDNTRLLGYSLGTGPATYLAANNTPASLTLVAPYTSMVDMKDRWFWWLPDFLLKYPLDSSSRIDSVRCDVAIYHGTDDELIPFAMAEELHDRSPERVNLNPLVGKGHRGAILALTPAWLRAR